MADWYGHARSNYFRVKDLEAFKKAMEPLSDEVEIWQHGDERLGPPKDDRIALGVTGSDKGGWPSEYYDVNKDEYVEVDVVDLVAQHLADDEVAIFMECGAEKLRYLTGRAWAVNNKGEVAVVDLEEIFLRARALTDSPENITEVAY